MTLLPTDEPQTDGAFELTQVERCPEVCNSNRYCDIDPLGHWAVPISCLECQKYKMSVCYICHPSECGCFKDKDGRVKKNCEKCCNTWFGENSGGAAGCILNYCATKW